MSLLQICADIAADAPVAAPSAIVTNTTDTNAQLLLACALRAGQSLARYKEECWAIQGREFDFTTTAVQTTGTTTGGSTVVTGIPSTAGIEDTLFGVAGNGIPANTYVAQVNSATQVTLTNPVAAGNGAAGVALTFGQFAYPLPSDFLRIITDTEWDRGRRWPMIGPRTPQQWQLYKSGLIGTATFQRRWRIKQLTQLAGEPTDYFCIDPVPSDNGTPLVFEYVSNAWCRSSTGTLQTRWLADTDVGLLDEYLIALDARWRFLNRLGLAYSAERDEAEREIAKAWANDGGMPILDMAPKYSPVLIGPMNVPDTGFGGVVR